MANKKLLFIGCLLPESYYREIITKKSEVDYACFKCQNTLLDGLKREYDSVKVISAPALTSFPKSNIFFFRRKNLHLDSNLRLVITGYINIPYVKLISQCIRVFLELLFTNKKETDIIIYSPHSAFIVALWPFLKKRTPSSLIIPDLPEFMSENNSRLYLFAKRVDHKLIDMFSKRIASYILFSPWMKERFNTRNKPTLLMEGVYKDSFITPVIREDNGEKIILYTGKADERYGIINLLDAFSMIESPNYQLWIRGDGNTIEEVKRRAEKDARIRHIGKLTAAELGELQQTATVLINPVKISEDFSKYIFPSKTFEYLASGTPTIMGRLQCMPAEYDPYIFYYESDSPLEIKNKIVEVCELPLDVRLKFGKDARTFVLINKNEKHQAGAIKSFMNTLTFPQRKQ